MNPLARFFTLSPARARVLPFAVFLALTLAQACFGAASQYWFYLGKTLVGGWMLWAVRSAVREMRWQVSGEAIATGVLVFALWVGLDRVVPSQEALWAKLGWNKAPAENVAAWNPFRQFGPGSALGWFFVAVRMLGSCLVVPPLEEIFYRSFLYRWISRQDFQNVPLGQFAWKPFLLASLIFGFAHNDWLAGIVCAACYQGLVCWNKRLGDAMTAHALTNALLGLWVVRKGAWHFW